MRDSVEARGEVRCKIRWCTSIPLNFDMTQLPTQQELSDLDDGKLDDLARYWRARAGRGDREAFGIAHALEVEHRRRQRASQLHDLPAPQPEPHAQPWWKFWAKADDSVSQSSS